MTDMSKAMVGITVVSKDRKGIVATITNFVFTRGGNIENINQNVIQGLFGMYVEASFQDLDIDSFDAELHQVAVEEELDVNIYHTASTQKNIAVLVTKERHCLDAILDAAATDSLHGKIAIVVGTEGTLQSHAEKAGIPFVIIPERNQEKAESQILALCKQYKIDLIVLARYMRILTPNFVWRYPRRIINIHPSLLPAFPGAYAYQQAFERGTKIVGVTSHYVTENLDQGPIILQESFHVDPADTLDSIKARGQRLEAQTLTNAVKLHLNNSLEVYWRKVHIKEE